MDGSGGSWQCHGDHAGRTAAASPCHLHNEIINDGLCAVASRGCWPCLFAQLESLEEKSKFGRGQGFYPKALLDLWVVGAATELFTGMECVSWVTAQGWQKCPDLGLSPAIVC